MAEILTKQETTEDLDVLDPGKYKVVVLNDDKTPMEFVIVLLMRIFHHSQQAAERLTMKIHNDGSATVGVYTYEVSEQKAIEGTNLARDNNFPLVIKVEEE
jgi:ATP-dependent Clp protease adaptor protein ClpS